MGVNMEDEKLYAALKLIEQLYLDELLPEEIYQDILDECSHQIDISRFTRKVAEDTETVA